MKSSGTEAHPARIGLVVEEAMGLVGKIQALDPIERAILSKEGLVSELRDGGAGRSRELLIAGVISKFGRLGVLAGMAATACSLLLYRTAMRGDGRPSGLEVFVGIGAIREKLIIGQIEREFGQGVYFIDQRTVVGVRRLPVPRLSRFLVVLWAFLKAGNGIWTTNTLGVAAPSLAATIMRRGGSVAYLVASMERLQPAKCDGGGAHRISVSTVDAWTHAASLAGLDVIYWQHGLVSEDLVYPSLAEVRSVTSVEGRAIAQKSGAKKWELQEYPLKFTADPRTVAIIGDYGAPPSPEQLRVLTKVCRAAKTAVVRPSPAAKGPSWAELAGIPGLVVDSEGTLEQFYLRWRPFLVVGRGSTGIIDGLRAGACPLLVNRPHQLLDLSMMNLRDSHPGDKSDECPLSPEQCQLRADRWRAEMF